MTVTYKNFVIYYDPPPIPDRQFDWQAVHESYDLDCGIPILYGESVEVVKQEIDYYTHESEEQK